MFRDDISLLSGNKLIETLNEENDMFGTIEKAENLISIFRDMSNDIDDIKMIGIYGEWGSGKTTYMNYVCKELNEIKVNDSRIYKAISFEAWKYEFDDSLHLSLMEKICQLSGNIQAELLEDCFLFLKNIVLNTNFSLEIPYFKLFGIKIDATKAIKDTIDNRAPISFYGKLNKFRESYEKLIDKILKEKNVEKLVVCIDDLDRCEPENVINLLSMIKHFFTYDERVKFICMLDKDAVSKAFLTKYGDVVKSKEYLEKIFDLNFTLNDSEDVSKLIKHYINMEEDATLVEEFLKNMGILNPRRMIKILNRSLFLERFLFKTGKYKYIFINTDSNSECINYSFKENSFFYSLLLYFVIYKEYYPDEFNRMFNIEEKIINFIPLFKFYSDSETSESKNLNIFTKPLYNILSCGVENIYAGEQGTIEGGNLNETSSVNTLQDDIVMLLMPFATVVRTFRKTEYEDFIKQANGIEGNYPYNFIKLYQKHKTKYFSINYNTKIYIYKLYKFVKDN